MLTLFGPIAVAVMLLPYWLEPRSKWFVLSFAGGCAATSAYSVLSEVYPITVIEALWALVALQRFLPRRQPDRKSNQLQVCYTLSQSAHR